MACISPTLFAGDVTAEMPVASRLTRTYAADSDPSIATVHDERLAASHKPAALEVVASPGPGLSEGAVSPGFGLASS